MDVTLEHRVDLDVALVRAWVLPQEDDLGNFCSKESHRGKKTQMLSDFQAKSKCAQLD